MVYYDLHDKMIIAHATIGSLATLIIIPSAILIARYRSKSNNFFKLHSILNYLGAFFLVITFSLGVGAVYSAGLGFQFSGPNSDLHHQTGLAILILLLLQVALGAYAHTIRSPSLSLDSPSSLPNSPPPPKKDWRRKLHIFLGISTMLSLYWITYEGMHDEWASMSDSLTVVPDEIQILFWVFFTAFIGSYTISYATESLRSIEASEYEIVGEKLVDEVEAGRGRKLS